MSTYFNLLNVKSRSKNVGTAPTPVPLAATARLIKKKTEFELKDLMKTSTYLYPAGVRQPRG